MQRLVHFPYRPKDFIETAEGLIFAVVIDGPQTGKVGCFLRYAHTETGWEKMTTDVANALLAERYPYYLYHSEQFDAAFHAVEVKHIIRHYKPEERLGALMIMTTDDKIVQSLQRLLAIMRRYGGDIALLGVTGSLLIGCQKATSDIDLVVCGYDAFQQFRSVIKLAVADGELSLLDEGLMREHFKRRSGALAYEDFAWHENRKFNKAVIGGVKFDIGMVEDKFIAQDEKQYQKCGVLTLVTTVVNDVFSFSFPARYEVEDKSIKEIVVYTQTYVGQAKTGEKIEVSGAVEYDVASGKRRLIVGSSREAVGEYIKVIKNNE